MDLIQSLLNVEKKKSQKKKWLRNGGKNATFLVLGFLVGSHLE